MKADILDNSREYSFIYGLIAINDRKLINNMNNNIHYIVTIKLIS